MHRINIESFSLSQLNVLTAGKNICLPILNCVRSQPVPVIRAIETVPDQDYNSTRPPNGVVAMYPHEAATNNRQGIPRPYTRLQGNPFVRVLGQDGGHSRSKKQHT